MTCQITHATHRALALSIFCVAPICTVAADWPNWRGPNHDGTIDAPGQFSDRAFGLEIVWKKMIGAGYSGMTVAQGRLLTMFADGESDLLAAFNAKTGSELWRFRMGDMYLGHDGGHDGPVSTPVADHSAVYALGADGRLVAVGLDDGSLRWSVNLVEKLRASVPGWGFTTTPLIVDDLIVVQSGGRNGRALTAFDKHDGTIRWTLGDGRIDYRSPALATLNGIRQLIVSTRSETMGVNPADGEKLWSRRFGSGKGSTPVPIEPDRVLLLGNGAQLLRIPKGGGKPSRIWRSSEFRGNFATPVFFQEHLYGFSGDVLTCVDAKTGKRRWRSRQPGGKGVILVDGHLVILGAKGDVVVAEASPSGYRERARVAVSDADGYASPCFSDGIIYARTLRGDVAAVRTIDGPTAVHRVASSTNRFERFIAKLTAAEDKRGLLDEFMDSRTSFPIVEDGRLVHFVYRGPAEDVSILGTMIAQGEHDQLSHVDGADLFYRSYPIEPGARFEYRFTVDFDNTGPDPLNSRRAPGNRAISEVVTPAWTQPHFVSDYDGPAAGRTESFSFASNAAGGSRRVRVYLPHGYDLGSDRYPTVVVTAGQDWLDRGNLTNTLNQLISSRIEPVIVAFALGGGGNRELGGNGTHSYVRMLATELIPELDRRFRTRTEADDRVILGHRGAAVAAVYAALEYPEVFGHCAAISFGRADTVRSRHIAGRIETASNRKPRFYITWNRYEIWRPQSFDVREQSKSLAAELERHGFEVLDIERNDSAGWGSWRVQAGEALSALLSSASL